MGRVVKALLRNAVSIIVKELSIVYLGRQRNADEDPGRRWDGERKKKKEKARNSRVFTTGEIAVGSLTRRRSIAKEDPGKVRSCIIYHCIILLLVRCLFSVARVASELNNIDGRNKV